MLTCVLAQRVSAQTNRVLAGVGATVAVAATLLLAGGPGQAVIPLPRDGQASYQLGGAYQPEVGARVVVRDSTARPAVGYYNICYINAFQTQPGTLNWWRAHRNALLLRKNGRLVIDQGWGEALLDTSTRAKRAGLVEVIAPLVRSCKTKGFQAVEFDNLDSYLRSRGRLRAPMNLTLARVLTQVAHNHGLAAGQKNAVELARPGRNFARFDFAIAEECQRSAECGGYQRIYGDRVIEVEYADYSVDVFNAACAARGDRISVIRRDRELRPAGVGGYVSQMC